jgi:hypothetical protein
MRAHHTMEGVAANREGTPRAAAAGELAQAYQRIAELEQVRGSERRAVPPAYVVRCMSYDIGACTLYDIGACRTAHGVRMTIRPAPSISIVRDDTSRRRQGDTLRIWPFAFHAMKYSPGSNEIFT